MKILLFAPSFETPAQQAASYPLALAYLGAVLENEGHSVRAFDYIHDDWAKVEGEVRKTILTEKPQIIGVSSMTTNRTAAVKLARIAKSIDPNIKVIFGGVHPTLMYKQILENFPVDFVVVGEGEETIIELVNAIGSKANYSKLKKIKGIAFKSENEVIRTENRPFLRDLDQLPMPKHVYFEDRIKRDKTFYISCSRGCPYACTFCSTSLHWGRMIRRRSVKSVMAEILFLKKKYPFVDKIIFNDDEFLMDHNWIKEFCNSMIKEKLNLTWYAAARVNAVSEDIVPLLKKAGCSSLSLGVESGSPKIIKSIDKKIEGKQIIRAFSICNKYNLPVGMFLMVGLPGENSQTINETIRLVKLARPKELGLPGLFQVFPGTQVYELAKKQGFITDDYWLTDGPAPFYTYENSRAKLLFWSFKICLYHKFYFGGLSKFIFGEIKAHLKFDKIKRTLKRYFI